MIGRLRSEDGIALVTAVVLMSLMIMVGLTAFAYVDTGVRESGRERVRESSFNLAEGVLATQTFLVARKWPETAATAFPRFCATTAIPDTARCPDPGFVSTSYSSPDTTTGMNWVVSVRDNGGDLPETTTKAEKDSSVFYDPADDDLIGGGSGRDDVASASDDANDVATDAQPTWDRNEDGRVWIRAQSTVRTKRRTLVALVDVDEVAEAFPTNVITTGKFTTGNDCAGNPHLMIKTNGSKVAVRNLGGSCWKTSQIDVPGAVGQVVDGGKALSDKAIEKLRQRAITDKTYTPSGCPASLAGAVVFIEDSGPDLCKYTGGTAYNCPEYGVVVVAKGGLYLGGTVQYCGVLYLANLTEPQSTGTLFDLQGNAKLQGAVAVDGPGQVNVGSNADNLTYDPNAIGAVRAYPTGAIVPSTWREIKG